MLKETSACFLLATSLSGAAGGLSPRTFCNPLPLPDLPRSVYEFGRTPHRQVSDPTLYRENGKWYVYPSAGLVWSSADDGGTWKAEPNPDGLQGHGPTMVKHGVRYFYMPDIRGTVYEAPKPEGPWKKLELGLSEWTLFGTESSAAGVGTTK